MIALAAGLALVLLGGLAAPALGRWPVAADRVFRGCVVPGCLLALLAGIDALGGMPDRPLLRAAFAPAAPGVPFGLDPLSAWFLIAVSGVAAAVAAYGVPYLARERPGRNVGIAHLELAVLIAALAGVTAARTVWAFLACWEVMALAGYLLILFERERRDVWDAGMIYLALTHVCLLALVGMFAAWTQGDLGWSFEDLARAASSGAVPTGLVLSLGLLGFGIKAGVFPFHFWLPGAHASAPSHVSALLSGAMLKLGIYGLVRVLALIGPPPAWWGWTVLLLGLASSVLGVTWALAQHDLKRLLAYHSVENIGIILLGIALGALGSAYHQPQVALLGYTGALLHVLNHALFKSLLFLGAGAVVHATGTRDVDRMGGLVRRMPRTAGAFLVGSAAIVGLPPLNGFVSEWLIFRGLLDAGIAGGGIRAASAVAAGLALTGALALACFTKLFGIVFLGVPRDEAATPRHAEAPGLVPPQVALAAACVGIGLVPVFAISPAARAVGLLVPVDAAAGAALVSGALPLSLLSAAILLTGALAWVGLRATPARRARRVAETWGCAFTAPSSRMQYTASSYAAPLLALFGPVTGSRPERTAGAFHTRSIEPVLDTLAHPLWARIVNAASRLRTIQAGAIRWYLLYVILCLFALLSYLSLRR